MRLRENGRYAIAVRIPLDRSAAEEEFRRRKETGEYWPFTNPRLAQVISITSPRYWPEGELDGDHFTTITGLADFASFVGVVDCSIAPEHTLRLEVASTKITYFQDFKVLLEDISQNILDLVFQVDSVSGLKFAAGEPGDVPPSVALFHLRRIMQPDELPAAVEAIIANPQTRLMQESRMVSPALAASARPDQLVQLAPQITYHPGGPLADLFLGSTPNELPVTRSRDSVDTPENRYVKAFMEDLSAFLLRLYELLVKARRPASQREVASWHDRIDDLLSASIWRDVGRLQHFPSNSQVLLRRYGYRDVLQADLLIQYGLVLPWERGRELAETVGDIRPIYELYEYWCFFTLRNVLREICGPEKPVIEDFYTPSTDRLEMSLRRGKKSQISYEYAADGAPVQVSLFYNREFRRKGAATVWEDSSYSAVFRPDYSIYLNAEPAPTGCISTQNIGSIFNNGSRS